MSNDTVTCILVEVYIDRGRDVLTTLVPKHEVDVLRAVHGPMNVREGEASDEELTLPVSADAEFGRLQGKYRRVNAPDPVGMAYRTGPAGLKEFGFELGRGSREAAPQAGIRTRGKPKAAAKDEKAKAPAK
jgi:hypothetical protein